MRSPPAEVVCGIINADEMYVERLRWHLNVLTVANFRAPHGRGSSSPVHHSQAVIHSLNFTACGTTTDKYPDQSFGPCTLLELVHEN